MLNNRNPSDVFLAQHAKLKPQASCKKSQKEPAAPSTPAASKPAKFSPKDYDLIDRLSNRVAASVKLLTDGGALAIGFESGALVAHPPQPPELTLVAFDGLAGDPSDLSSPRRRVSLSSVKDFPMMKISPFAIDHVLSSFSCLAARARLRLTGEEAFLDHSWKVLASYICKADIAYRSESRIIQSPLDLAKAALDPAHPLSAMDPAELAFFAAERERLMTRRARAGSTRVELTHAIAKVFDENIISLEKAELLSHADISVALMDSGKVHIFSNSYFDRAGVKTTIPRFSNLGVSIFIDPLSSRSHNAFSRLVEARTLSSLGEREYIARLWMGVAAKIAEAGALLRSSVDLPLPQGLHAESERQELSSSICAPSSSPKRTRSAL